MYISLTTSSCTDIFEGQMLNGGRARSFSAARCTTFYVYSAAGCRVAYGNIHCVIKTTLACLCVVVVVCCCLLLCAKQKKQRTENLCAKERWKKN